MAIQSINTTLAELDSSSLPRHMIWAEVDVVVDRRCGSIGQMRSFINDSNHPMTILVTCNTVVAEACPDLALAVP